MTTTQTTWRKKGLALLLTAAMTLTLLSLTAAPAYAATGTLFIDEQSDLNLASDHSGEGWTWTASSATLTLDDSYGGDFTGASINILCHSTDNITLVYMGDIEIYNGIYCDGNLDVSGSGGVLNLNGDQMSYGLRTVGALQISGGSVYAAGDDGGIYAQTGLTVSGAASLTAIATGSFGHGIEVYDGKVVVSTTGTVSVRGRGATGFAVTAGKDGSYTAGLLGISGGTVTLENPDAPANLISGGLNHTGGTLNGYAAGAFPGGSVTIAGDLTGGDYAGNGKGASGFFENYDPGSYAYASGNSLTIASGSFTDPSFSGGYSNRDGEHASGNSVTVNGGDFSGATVSGGQAGNYTVSGEANGNTVVMTNFSGMITTVYGARSYGDATGNTVSVSGGDNINYVYGGCSDSGSAAGNTVTLTGGTFNYGIYGADALYDATGNTVTIEAGATLDENVSLYGGFSALTGDAVTGNILNLKQSGITISYLGNFAEYNFTLPASIAAGGTVITASDGYDGMSAIDVAGIAVGLAFDGVPSLAVGDKITLIDGGAHGVTGAPATTSLNAAGYIFGIAVESGKLVATVTGIGTAPTITTTALPNGTVGTAYSRILAATGDTPVSWSVDSGALPDGLSLNDSTGEISGTPTTAETASFTVKATNSAGDDTKQLSITIDKAKDDGDGTTPPVVTPPVTTTPPTATTPTTAITPATATTEPPVPMANIPAAKTPIAPGKSSTLPKSVTFGDGTSADVTWTSGNPAVAKIDAGGTIVAIGEGRVTLTARAANGKTQTVTVTVAKPVTEVRTPLTKMYLKTGKSLTPPVCAYSVNAATKKAEATAKLTWKSSKPKVAAVNPSTGKITPKKPGKATITATALNGKKLTINVTVVKKATLLKKVTLTNPPKSLKAGKTALLKVKTSPAKATNLKVTFKSSKPKIIQVDKAGKLTALKKGKANITVKIGNRKYVRAITVK